MFAAWIPAILSGSVFGISFLKEKRHFRNAVYFLIFLCCVYLGMVVSSGRNALLYAGALLILFLIPVGAVMVSVIFVRSGIIAVKREGFRLKNLLSILFVVVLWGGLFVMLLLLLNYGKSRFTLACAILIFMAEAYVIFTFVALFLYSLLYRSLPKNPACDFIIVHGAGLRKDGTATPLLAGRLDKAKKLFDQGGRGARIIVSGGQGPDEVVSEARAMHDYLVSAGVPEQQILLEDQSATTYENMKNAKAVIDRTLAEEHKTSYRCIFVTSDYHVFRAGIYARQVGLKADGVGSRTAGYYFPNAFLREYAAVMARHKRLPVVLLLLWAAGTAVLCLA